MKNSTNNGYLEVISGCMFSGKTNELIRSLRRSKMAGDSIVVFKPVIDNRWGCDFIVSHDDEKLPSIVVGSASDILAKAANATVIGIDEGQFLDEEILAVCKTLAQKGRRIIVAGLDMDYRGEPFGPVPVLMAIAERVTKLSAICMQCGRTAHYSHRLINKEETIVIGDKDIYEARCRRCFNRIMN